LIASDQQEWIAADEQSAGPLLDEGCECGVEVAFAAGVYDNNLLSDSTTRLHHVFPLGLGMGAVWVHE